MPQSENIINKPSEEKKDTSPLSAPSLNQNPQTSSIQNFLEKPQPAIKQQESKVFSSK